MSQSSNCHKREWQSLSEKINKRVESYIIFTLHAGNVRLRCRETVKTHQKRVNSVNHTFIERAVDIVAPASTCWCSCWRQTFRAYDVKTMWLTTRLTISETITASGFVAIQQFIKIFMWVLHWRLHFKFPNVVTAHILREVDTLFIVLISVSSRTCLPILLKLVYSWPT